MSMDIIAPIDKNKFDDTIDLSANLTCRKRFLKKLQEKEIEYFKRNELFSFRAAKYDFEEAQNDLFKRKGRNLTFQDALGNKHRVKYSEQVEIDIDKFDFKKYAEFKRFKKIAEKDMMDDQVINGLKRKVKIGIYKKYVDTEFGNIIKMPHFLDPNVVGDTQKTATAVKDIKENQK